MATSTPESDARFVVDVYFSEREIRRPLFGREVTQYHRPLQTYVEALAAAGFRLVRLVELPTERPAAVRVPMFAHLHAVAV